MKKQLSIVAGLLVIAVSSLLAIYRQPASGRVELLAAIALAILVGAIVEAIKLILEAIREPNPGDTFSALGMNRVSLSLGDDVLRDTLAEANRIKVMKTWFPETAVIAEGLTMAIRRGARVDLLLANPFSKVLAVRSEGAGQSGDHGRFHVLRALSNVARTARETEARGVRVVLKVGLYDTWPGCPTIRCDDKILLGFYFRDFTSPQWPWVEVTPTSPLGRILEEQFLSLESHSSTIWLSSADEIDAWLKAHSARRSRQPRQKSPALSPSLSTVEEVHH